MSDLRRAWDNAVRAAEFRGYVAGRMGYVDESGMVTILVPNRPNHCYVSLGAEGDQGVTIARNLGAPRIAWVPIRLKREQGELLIEGLDPTPGRLEAFFGGEAAPGNVSYHTHKIGSGLEYEVEALRLQPGRVRAAGGMDVYIEAFRYYVGGAWQTWEGGTLDLTAYRPSTADKWAWVLVGINPNTNAAIAVTGDEYDVETELTADLIDDIDFGDYIPCGAVKVREDDTAVTDIADYADAHGWFGDGSRTFLGLTDTPVDYTDDDGKLLVVTSGEDAVEFVELGAKIAAATSKATPVDADNLALSDSAASNILKRLTWSNLKATLKTYFDGLYLLVGGKSGGQVAYGGTDSGDDLELRSTSNAVKGQVIVADDLSLLDHISLVNGPDGSLRIKDGGGTTRHADNWLWGAGGELRRYCSGSVGATHHNR